jgi:hypothetical protein
MTRQFALTLAALAAVALIGYYVLPLIARLGAL